LFKPLTDKEYRLLCYPKISLNKFDEKKVSMTKTGFELTLHPNVVDLPRQWKKPKVVFVNSMSDLFHKDVPLEFIQKVFKTMNEMPQHIYQVLTKRASRLAELIPFRFLI